MVLFSDPVLNALIARAEQQSFGLCEAYQRIVEARAWAKMTRGGLLPQAEAIAEYGRTKRSSNARPFVGTNGVAFDLFSLGFDSSWEIDLFGKLHRQIEVSEAELEAMQDNYQDVRLTLLTDVASNYVRVRVLQQQLQVAQHNIKLQEETSELIEKLQKSGKVSTLDVAQAKALRYATLSEVPQLEQQLQLAYNQLSILLGEAPGPEMRACIGYGPIPSPPELGALGIPADLVRRRPDIRRAEQEVVAASARIGVATADLYPQLSLLGALSVDSQKVSSLFTSESLTYAVGPSFRWNILNFWRVTSSIRAYEAQYEQAIARYRSAVLNAVREVEDSLNNNHWESFRKTALEQTTQADAKSVEISLSRYKSGKANYQRILDSQKQLMRDQQQLAISQGNLALEMIRISKAVGGGWCLHSSSVRGQASTVPTPANLLFPLPEKSSDDSSKESSSKKSTKSDSPKEKPTKAKLKKPADKKAPKPPAPNRLPEKTNGPGQATPTLPTRSTIPKSSGQPSDKPITTDSDSMWRLPSEAPAEKSQASQASPKQTAGPRLPGYPSTSHQSLNFANLSLKTPSPATPKASRPTPSQSQTPTTSPASYSPQRGFAPSARATSLPISSQPLWRKLAIGALTILTVGLSFSLLSILTRR